MNLRAKAAAIKRDVHALYLAARDPRVPWYAKAVAVAVAGYAISPIDLIPDFIPVLGQLDDLVIVPLGIVLAVRLVPPALMKEFRDAADAGGVGGRGKGKGLLEPRALSPEPKALSLPYPLSPTP